MLNISDTDSAMWCTSRLELEDLVEKKQLAKINRRETGLFFSKTEACPDDLYEAFLEANCGHFFDTNRECIVQMHPG